MKRLSEMKISGGQKRYIGLLLGLTFLGILLLSMGGENSSESPPPITTTETKTLTADEKLAQILSQVEGAGQVEGTLRNDEVLEQVWEKFAIV